jgi:hypothetical protein
LRAFEKTILGCSLILKIFKNPKISNFDFDPTSFGKKIQNHRFINLKIKSTGNV